ncbi:MAG: FAD-dependent oxidoreductase [Bdellovibrionaceae bacterium]|nr:FAD-dependent oxidoreductase [Bdellovibrio sp.]
MDGQQYLSLEYIQQSLGRLQDYVKTDSFNAVGSYFLIYVICTALSFPGATILTLLAGALFGAFYGTIIVSFASTIGATLAFLSTRFLARDYVMKKVGARAKAFDEGVKKDGSWYLFTMRLLPVFPFFVINLAMGLTSISVKNFFFVSQLGMLPGTFVYVNAGQELAQITSLSGILSPRLFLAFSLLGLLPLIIKFITAKYKSYKVYEKYKKPKKFDYNIAVIGAGSGGLVTAYIAAAVKAKVILIEKHKMGGDCLYTGCVPSKALIRTARFMREQKLSKDYGVQSASAELNFSAAMSRVHNVIKKIEPHDSVERYSELGVECVQDEAFVVDPWTVRLKDRQITAKNIVIATGAKPRVPDIEGLKTVPFVTSDTIWGLTELPKKFLVLGGGPIGSELAQAFAALGSEVTILEMGAQILGREDRDVVELMTNVFKRERIKILKQIKVKSFEKTNEKNLVVIENNGVVEKIEFDLVLLATGREANVKGFGLEQLGIELTDRKTIQTDAYLRTNIPNIYACGDVVGPYQFTHAASHQAWFTSVNSLFSPFKKFKINYDHLPWSTFTHPEISRIGLNEADAKEKKIEYEITKYEINDLDRAIADSSDYGFVKVLTVPGKDKILGVTIVADHSSDLLPEFVIAMKYGLGLNKILSTIHSYPTMAEANKYAAGVWKKAHAPKKVLQFLKKFHAWRRS